MQPPQVKLTPWALWIWKWISHVFAPRSRGLREGPLL